MPTLNVNDITIYYEQHGSGPDLILIGGLTSDHQVWKSTIRLFSPHFRVLIFDNRGVGLSSTPDYPYTIEMMAKDVLGLMDALSISRAHVIGHSMGGAIAQQMALLAPDKINKLVIMCARAKATAISSMILSTREALQASGVTDQLLAEYMMPMLFSENFLKNIHNVKGFVQWSLQNKNLQTAIGYKNQLHAVLHHDVSDQLHNITTPTLVIAGNEDLLMPVRDAEKLAKAIKNATFVNILDCAHMPHVEKSREFFDCVMRFCIDSLHTTR